MAREPGELGQIGGAGNSAASSATFVQPIRQRSRETGRLRPPRVVAHQRLSRAQISDADIERVVTMRLRVDNSGTLRSGLLLSIEKACLHELRW